MLVQIDDSENNSKTMGIVTENIIDLSAKQKNNLHLTCLDENDGTVANAALLVADYMQHRTHPSLTSNYISVMLSSLEFLQETYGAIDSIVLVFNNEVALRNKIFSDDHKLYQQHLIKEGYKGSKENRMRYRLWVDLNKNNEKNRKCIYTGERMTLADAMDRDKVNIDHIIPHCISKNNSTENLLLCMKTANIEKNDKIPRQKWSSDKARWRQIYNRCKFLPENKAKRVRCKEKDLEPIERYNGDMVMDIVLGPRVSEQATEVIHGLSRHCNNINVAEPNHEFAKEIYISAKGYKHHKKAIHKFNYKLLEVLMR